MDRSFHHAAPRKEPAKSDKIVSLDAFRRSKLQPNLVRVEFGSGWYHDAAIKHDHVRPADVP